MSTDNYVDVEDSYEDLDTQVEPDGGGIEEDTETPKNHYFDTEHPLRPYTYSLHSNPGSYPPVNALRDEEPVVKEGFWPCELEGKWVDIEDHRDTEYWLPGDTWETEARKMKDLGPLPEGYILTPPPKTPEEILTQTLENYESRIQQRLDAFARTLTYDGILSACTYATSSIEMYRIEGQYCVDVRDSTWAEAYMLLQEIRPQVEAGGEIPEWEEIEVHLPPLAWPEGSRGYVG